jgi:antitoxin ParD1/3/4
MSVTLAPELADRIREKIAAGRYRTANEVVEEALQALDERERLEQLRAKLQVGIDQLDRGEGIPFTPELLDEIDREVDERLRRGEQPSPDVCP